MKPTIDDLWYKKDPDNPAGKKILTDLGARMMARPAARRGLRFRVRYAGGSQSFRTMQEARAFADEIKDGRGRDKGATVRQYADEYRVALQESGDHRPTTVESLDRYLKLHVYPILLRDSDVPLGNRVMNEVTALHIQEWLGILRAGRPPKRKPLASTTVTTIRAHLKGIFTAAHDDERIDRNPFQTTAMKKKRRKPTRRERIVPPTAAEIRAAADALPPRYRALVLVAAGSGLRQGELWGLEPKHVNLEDGTITVEQQVQTVGTRRYLAPVKSEAGMRTVEIATYARDALAEHMEAFPPVDFLMDDNRDEDRPGARLAKLIFTTVDGQPLNRAQWAHQWTPARQRAGVDFRFHDLRHYYATVLIKGGADVKEVQVALGHSSARLVLETYAGYWRKSDESQRAALDKNWFND